MKTLLVTILLATSMVLNAQRAVEHMQSLSVHVDQISKDTWDYVRQVAKGRNANKIEKRRVELANTLKTAGSTVARVPGYEGDTSLKDAYGNYLRLCYLSINEDYKRIVDMERIAEESYDAMEAYILLKERVKDKMDSAYATLDEARDSFAEKYGIQLIEGEETRLSRKLANASAVNKYINKLYLIFYKSAFYEQEMVEAMSAGNVGDIEQYRQTVETVTTEGAQKIKELPAFRGDNSLKEACLEMLSFYQQEATKSMPSQIAFFTKKDRMETLQRNMEAKKKKDLTQADIDEYNNAITSYNEAINSFNGSNEMLNKGRAQNLKKWNKALDSFESKFI
ncbi:MAG: hypothetical protein AAGA85_22095 [Bacteroidota bacterium]